MLEYPRSARSAGSDDGSTSKKPKDLVDDMLGGNQRIRCPKCRWQPSKNDRWHCRCGCIWNTFDTRGVCPGCHFVWQVTACLSCGAWSEHEDWYEKAPDPS